MAVEEVKETGSPDSYELNFNGEFNQTYMEQIFDLIDDIPPSSKLLIWINSNGGSVHTGLMLKEKLESKALDVTFISRLFNASMGALMPQIGDYIRLTYPHSVFTFHEVAFKHTGSLDELKSLENYSFEAANLINDLVMEKVGLTKKEFKKYNGYDLIQFGYQLLDVGQHGFIDGLILRELTATQFLIKTRDGNKIIDITKHKRSDIKDLPVVE